MEEFPPSWQSLAALRAKGDQRLAGMRQWGKIEVDALPLALLVELARVGLLATGRTISKKNGVAAEFAGYKLVEAVNDMIKDCNGSMKDLVECLEVAGVYLANITDELNEMGIPPDRSEGTTGEQAT